MNEILLSNEVIVYLLSETVLFLLLVVAFLVAVELLRKWDFNAFTATQFKLENRSYLVMSIIFFVLILKILLLPYFVYTIDRLSDLVPGAMCGAGVIKANAYGYPLLGLKIVILFLGGVWLSINRLDLEAKNYPWFKIKLWLFVLIFLLLGVEFALDILYFIHIETIKPVSCCSVIFGQTAGRNGLPLGLDIPKLLILFFLLYILIVLTILNNMALVSLFAAGLFLVIAYYAVVYFFGIYIYQIPTHKCPFCMLQGHYHYVGYILWGSLLWGVFSVIDQAVLAKFFHKPSKALKRNALLLLTLFIMLCSSYVVIYYLKNGVLL